MSLSDPSMTFRAPRASQRLIAIMLACAVATPSVAAVDCYEQMSRIPTASAAPAPVGYRASMLRGAPLAAASPSKKPAAHRPARKATRKAKGPRTAAVVRKAKGSGKKVVRKAYANGGPAKRPRRAVAAAPALGPLPTPPAVAARNIATLREFTLIKTTICTTIAPPAVIVAPPIEPETVTVLPPLVPDTFNPDLTVRPPTDFVVVVRPPRPPGPPAIVRPVPEPGTWLLLIFGFGVLGARLRARRTAIG
jgi:hypothetical protein